MIILLSIFLFQEALSSISSQSSIESASWKKKNDYNRNDYSFHDSSLLL